MDEKRDKTRTHLLTLTNRTQLAIEGVQHVENFDDDVIMLSTDMGILTIKGHNLRIHQLDLDSGSFVAEGDIDSLVYSRKKPGKSDGTWARLWR
ncbi:MAG: sporulation protein YabP [Sulfobacillus thermosulfidooxidans]|uniref:Sporulation protein YabP n=1 Tax=Sulfobacillus thermosulfidooxidans TaxID=28034 RepID=A0A2T2X2W0_SULTH|nr:sporulation protein YabP [Sulfobacillus thermosulfidooxidans]PSR28817.1 MAG: sporulation protein YabP [Sulfobacillus thermosulfidooxidans]